MRGHQGLVVRGDGLGLSSVKVVPQGILGLSENVVGRAAHPPTPFFYGMSQLAVVS